MIRSLQLLLPLFIFGLSQSSFAELESLEPWRLVWSQEFKAPSSEPIAPDPTIWKYKTGNHNDNWELETSCAYGSNVWPCQAKLPNSYIGGDGFLHLIARRNEKGQYTSARMTTQGLWSVQYGRIEIRAKMPGGKGIWPAFWMLGDSFPSTIWPDCGEIDIMETIGQEINRVGGAIHGKGFTGPLIVKKYFLRRGRSFADAFHVFGMIWKPGLVEFYVDNPRNIYGRYTPRSLPRGAVWPFDSGRYHFILNLSVGGMWPGNPDKYTHFPSEMLVEYIRLYQPKHW